MPSPERISNLLPSSQLLLTMVIDDAILSLSKIDIGLCVRDVHCMLFSGNARQPLFSSHSLPICLAVLFDRF